MPKPYATVLLLLSFSISANAGPRSLYLTNAWRWASKHKLELGLDASMLAASAADVETSYISQHQACGCVYETNMFLPRQPSRAQLWGIQLAFGVPLMVANHYVIKWRPERQPWQDTLPLIIPAIWDAQHSYLANHNAGLIQ